MDELLTELDSLSIDDCLDFIEIEADQSKSPEMKRLLLRAACDLLAGDLFGA